MSESRFYKQENYICARCGFVLEWRVRTDSSDSLLLLHPNGDCLNAGKGFYAPVHHFEEYPPEALAEALAREKYRRPE